MLREFRINGVRSKIGGGEIKFQMESKTIVREGRSLLKKGSLNRRWKNCEFYTYGTAQERWGCKDLSAPLGGHREELHNGRVRFFPIYHETRCFPSRVDSRIRYYRYDLDRISAASLSFVLSCLAHLPFFAFLRVFLSSFSAVVRYSRKDLKIGAEQS